MSILESARKAAGKENKNNRYGGATPSYKKTTTKDNKTTSTKKTSSILESARIASEEYKTRTKVGFDTINDDLNALNTRIDGIYKNWHDKDTMSAIKTDIENMYGRLTAYEDYRKNYGGDNLTDASGIVKAYKGVLDEWDNISTTYGNYNSAEEYSEMLKMVEKLEGLETKTTAEYF